MKQRKEKWVNPVLDGEEEAFKKGYSQIQLHPYGQYCCFLDI